MEILTSDLNWNELYLNDKGFSWSMNKTYHTVALWYIIPGSFVVIVKTNISEQDIIDVLKISKVEVYKIYDSILINKNLGNSERLHRL